MRIVERFVAGGSIPGTALAIENKVYCQVVVLRRPDVELFLEVLYQSAAHNKVPLWRSKTSFIIT